MTLRRSTALKRTGRWRARLTAKRRGKREARAEWAVAVKRRDHYCRYTLPEWGGFYCRLRATDAHHVLARSQGGADDLSNGLGLCHDHHMWAHDNPKLASMHGLLAHVGDCCDIEPVGASEERKAGGMKPARPAVTKPPPSESGVAPVGASDREAR